MEQFINSAMFVWSVIGMFLMVTFIANAYMKCKSYHNRIKHVFIDGDSVIVVSTEDEAPMGSIALEVLEVNHLAA